MENARNSADVKVGYNDAKRFMAEAIVDEKDTHKQNSPDQEAMKKDIIEPDVADQGVTNQDSAVQHVSKKSVAEFEQDITDQYAIEQDVSVQDGAGESIIEQDVSNTNVTEQIVTDQIVADQIVDEQDAIDHDVTAELNSPEQEASENKASRLNITESEASKQDASDPDVIEQNRDAAENDAFMQDISEQDTSTQDNDSSVQDNISEQDVIIQDKDASMQDISQQDVATQDKDALIQEQDGMELVIVNHGATTQDTTKKLTTEKKDNKMDVTWQETFKEDATTKQDVVNDREVNRRRMFLRFLEVSVLVFVMLLLTGLFLIPTFFYAFTSQLADTTPNASNNSETCENAVPYSGEVCADVFLSLQECYSDDISESSLAIPSNIEQSQAESNADQLLMYLPLLQPTEECTESIKPFLCLHLFGFCDSNVNYHTTLRSECFRLREDVCYQEWMMAVDFLPPDTLPKCEELLDRAEECRGNNTFTATEEGSVISLAALNCSRGFFHDMNNTGLCRPKCGEFGHKGYAFQIPEIIAMCVSLLASVGMFILALTYQRSTLLTFPSILLVYLCGTTFLLSVVITIGSFDNKGLFCSTEDQILAASQGNETAYCTFSGIVFQYTLAQTCVWALLHAIFLFWSLVFPFNYRRLLRLSGKAHYAHAISVLVALLLPLPGALAPLKDGFISTRNPSLVCQARNADYIYFSLVLPLSVVLAVSSCLMVVTFWIIFKEFVLKKLIAGKKVGKIGKAEIKMAVISSYYIVVGVLSLFTFTYFEVKAKANRDSLVNLFLCESSGNSNCEARAKTVSFEVLDILSDILLILVGFFPVVALLFSYDTRTYKKVRGSLKITSQSSRRSSSLHKNLPAYRSKKLSYVAS